MTPFVNVLWPTGLSVKNVTASAETTATDTHTVTLGAYSAGDLIIVLSRTAATDEQTPPSGWTQIIARDDGGDTRGWYRVMDGSEGSTVTYTAENARRSASIAYVIEGAATGEASFVVGSITGSLDPPSVTPGWTADTLWITMAGLRQTDNTLTMPSGYGNQVDSETGANQDSSAHCRIASAYRFNEAASEDPATWGSSGTVANPHAATIAVRPA